MPTFRYKTRHKHDQKLVTGLIEASTEQEAIKKLRAKDLLILSVKPDSAGLNISFSQFLNRVGNKDRVLFTRELAVMIKAGLPILQALRAIQDQTTNRPLKKALHALAVDVQGGSALSEAFAHQPRIFKPIFISVTKSGEKSGQLEEVLERLANQLEKDDDLVSKIKGAMIYPAFVLCSLVGVMILIVVYIIPQLSGVFEESSVELPLITRSLLALSDIVRQYAFVWVALIVVMVIALKLIGRKPKGAYFFEQLRFRLPVFGKLYRKVLMARFTHTLATLLAAGLPVIEALKTTSDVMNSQTYRRSFDRIAVEIENGKQLSQSLLDDKEFPAMIGHMIAIGESSGSIDTVLETVASFFDKEVETLTTNLSTLLEPVLMVMMGLGVGLVIASVIMPIYNLVNVV